MKRAGNNIIPNMTFTTILVNVNILGSTDQFEADLGLKYCA